jgi:hypothetical protein
MLTVAFANRLNLFAHKLQQHLAPLGARVQVSQRGISKRRVYLEWPDETPDQVYCFVRVGDGAILKATSWGSCVYANPICAYIYDEDCGLRTCTQQGVCYPGVPVNHPKISKLQRP